MIDHIELSVLAGRAKDGDEQAVAEVLRRLSPAITRTVRLIVGAGSWVAEDAAQEALLDVARGLPRLQDPGALWSWALRVTSRRAIKIARREALFVARRSLHDVEVVSAESPSERMQALRDAFGRLPARMRGVVVLRLYVGLSEAETAEALGCSVGTVKSQLHEGRERLASMLERQGFAPLTTAINAQEEQDGQERRASAADH